MPKLNLLNYDLQGLQQLFAEFGEPVYRAKVLLRWIHQHQVTDFASMTDFSKALRQRLAAECVIQLPEIALERVATDGVIKWLLRLTDGNCIETVYIPDRERGTLCISSQVGCALNCSFCATGKEGFNRNLEASEIISQVWLAKHRLDRLATPPRKITNIVFMGMGEPLLNYDPVLIACNNLLHDFAYGLSKYRVTVSTSGVLPAMRRLAADSEVSIAVSLHAPTDSLRDQLVPLNRKYPLADLMQVCRDYYPQTSARKSRKIFFEYVMLDQVNDLPQHATQLIKLLQGIPAKLNLIPYNPYPGDRYQRSSAERVQAFQQRLIKAGLNTRVRRTRGDGIEAACGQLAGQIRDRTGRYQRWLRTGRLVPEPVKSVRR